MELSDATEKIPGDRGSIPGVVVVAVVVIIETPSYLFSSKRL
jgi:hypothetical protein